MSLNLLTNPGFESGSLSPWHPSTPNVATITEDPETAYTGNYYLSLETAVGNRGNTISQHVHDLTPGTNYTVSLQARVIADYGANYCSTYIYARSNSTMGAIASLIDTPSEWTQVEGWYVPTSTGEVLNIVAGCTFSGSSYTGMVLFDEVVCVEV
ncbi:hypothetical protein BJX99DRAFT_81414 [Aspergillus californicus]